MHIQHAQQHNVCERKKEKERERKNEVNVPSSEVTLTSRRAHFLLIASIAGDISSSFTRELLSCRRVKSAAAFTSSPPPTPPPHATLHQHHHHHSSPPHFSS